jgi:acetolactate synthase-1/2/3 large subunit
MKKVSDFVFEYIAEIVKVRDIFILPGGGCMHLVDSLGKNPKLNFICNLHEQATAIAAEAYGQYTNNLGVALVTAGPGSTNAITGLAGGWIDSTPMLILSGQAKCDDLMTGKGIRQMGIQEVDIASIVKPITKYAHCIKDPQMIKYELQKAIYLAQHGRKGPVWLDIPLDVQGAFVDEDKLKEFVSPEDTISQEAYDTFATKVLELLRGAKNPAILVGNGVRLAGAIKEFVELAEKLQIPVMTTWKTVDFLPEEHPLFVGRPGVIASRGANFVQQNADILLILSTRLDLCQTGFNHPHFAAKAKKIILDIDQNEINKLDMDFELSMAGDVGKFIKSALSQIKENTVNDCAIWLARCKEWQKKYPVILPEYCDESAEKVNTYHFIEVISELLDENTVLIPGSSGACAELTMQAVKVKEGQRILNTPGLGAMGFGLPATIGACIAAGGKKTIGIVGDGGVQMNIQELQTIARLNLPIKMFVLNNAGYGSIYHMQKNRFDGNLVACNADSGLELPDICKLAEVYNLKSVRIENAKELKEKVAEVLSFDGPVICDVMVDPEGTTAPRLASEVLPDGKIVSKPMEDLAPFLDREEFNKNMEN